MHILNILSLKTLSVIGTLISSSGVTSQEMGSCWLRGTVILREKGGNPKGLLQKLAAIRRDCFS